MDNLWQPDRGIEEQDGPGLVQQDALEDDGGEASDVEDYVEPGQPLAHELLVIHLLLVQLGAPADNEQAGLKSEAADEVPEGWQAQILHEFALSLDRELEVDGEKEEVPDQVQAE